MNNVQELEDINHLYRQILKSSMDILLYDCSTLCATQLTTMNILDSHIARTIPLPTSPPSERVLNHSNPTSPASFKPPKLFTANWSVQSYDFYPWLFSIHSQIHSDQMRRFYQAGAHHQCYKVAEDLSPKIKTLLANLEIIQ